MEVNIINESIWCLQMEQLTLFNAPGGDEAAKSLLSNLLDQSRLFRQSKDYLELLDFVSKLPNFAPFNAFLLNLQKPGLRFASSQYDWRHRFKREVKEGARPLLILWPFGPVALVYDLEDTEGEPLPESIKKAFRAVGEVTPNIIDKFIGRLRGNGIYLKLIEYGDAHAGHIQAVQEPEGLEIGQQSTNAKIRPAYHIRVNSKHDPNVQFVTLIHELAHLYLGHLGPDKYLKIAKRHRPKHQQRELEAESVAYLVCKRSEVESGSEKYLANFVMANTTMKNLDFYLTLKAAGQIETLLHLGDMVSFGPQNK